MKHRISLHWSFPCEIANLKKKRERDVFDNFVPLDAKAQASIV